MEKETIEELFKAFMLEYDIDKAIFVLEGLFDLQLQSEDYQRHPKATALLSGFKNHLTGILQAANEAYQTEKNI